MGILLRLLLAYLLGAFPTALVIGRVTRGIDIRDHGSGNAGATNAWRVLGWKAGISVLLVDMAKGALAAAAVSRIPLGTGGLDPTALALLCGVVAVLGHVFPVYTRFRGGKGVATAGGMLFAVAPIPMAISLGLFLLAVTTTGRISVGSLAAAVGIPVCVGLLRMPGGARYPAYLLGLTAALAAFIFWTHRSNLRRLLRGEERVFRRLQLWRLLRR
ncbi:MAG: glycerol-3-phosphate 1-O-acyltransferase PlsY [Candidatus Bipolaricaulota bacterium]|nr:MAG: glycerol-3-phosphate 1-O-acyltransferase PlsY [Candidatus Bipolaricaulota bacterium]